MMTFQQKKGKSILPEMPILKSGRVGSDVNDNKRPYGNG
jgi:hypothetical protein